MEVEFIHIERYESALISYRHTNTHQEKTHTKICSVIIRTRRTRNPLSVFFLYRIMLSFRSPFSMIRLYLALSHIHFCLCAVLASFVLKIYRNGYRKHTSKMHLVSSINWFSSSWCCCFSVFDSFFIEIFFQFQLAFIRVLCNNKNKTHTHIKG